MRQYNAQNHKQWGKKMTEKQLALKTNGEITYCTDYEETIGEGTCDHLAHQKSSESNEQFMERVQNDQVSKRIQQLDNISTPWVEMEGQDNVINTEKQFALGNFTEDEYRSQQADNLYNDYLTQAFYEEEATDTGATVGWPLATDEKGHTAYDFDKIVGEGAIEKSQWAGISQFVDETHDNVVDKNAKFNDWKYTSESDSIIFNQDGVETVGSYENHSVVHIVENDELRKQLRAEVINQPEEDNESPYVLDRQNEDTFGSEQDVLDQYLKRSQLLFKTIDDGSLQGEERDEKIIASMTPMFEFYENDKNHAAWPQDEDGNLDFDKTIGAGVIPKDKWSSYTEKLKKKDLFKNFGLTSEDDASLKEIELPMKFKD